MKILHTVESYLPARHGMAEVVRQLSERLVARGHQVTVATSRDPARTTETIAGVRVRDFAVGGKAALGIWGEQRAYQHYLLNCDADVIVNFAAQQWATDLTLPLLKQLKPRKVFVPTGFSALGDPLFQNYFSSMGEHMRSYDACVFLSDSYRDIEFARREHVNQIAIIPNGASSEEFSSGADSTLKERLGIPRDNFLVIHIAGYLSEAKGQADAIKIFSRSELTNSTLLLVSPDFSRPFYHHFSPLKLAKSCYHLARGKRLQAIPYSTRLSLIRKTYERENKKFNRQILGLNLSRSDTVAAYLTADLLLFPSWIECSPIVLFEAAASRTPFLATNVGNAAEIINWTGGGRLLPGLPVNDAEGSVRADIARGSIMLNEIYQNREKRLAMAERAHGAWLQHFTWERITDQYEKLYTLLQEGHSICDTFMPPPAI